MSKARGVVSMRLSEAEKAVIDAAAARQRVTASEFLRQAALLLAHRLSEATKPRPRAIDLPVRASDDGPHGFRTWSSGEAYLASQRGGLGSGPDTAAMAAETLRRLEKEAGGRKEVDGG